MFHPLRRSASGRSAKGWSATRSDSQRWRKRTGWDGHPAWGSALRPSIALPKGKSANGGGEEKNGGESSDLSRFAHGTAVTAKAVRPFLFLGPWRPARELPRLLAPPLSSHRLPTSWH